MRDYGWQDGQMFARPPRAGGGGPSYALEPLLTALSTSHTVSTMRSWRLTANFLLECVKRDLGNGPDLKESQLAASDQIDWENLFHCGDKILPYLSKVLTQNRACIRISEQEATLFKLPYRSNLRKNEERQKEVLRVATRCQAENLPLIFFKGSALLFTVYQDDPGIRKMEDIDVLLENKDDLPRLITVLEQLGYSELEDTTHRGKDFAKHDWWLENHFHLCYWKDPWLFELHWKTDFGSNPLLQNILVGSTTAILRERTVLRILAPECSVLMACTNFIKDFKYLLSLLGKLGKLERKARVFCFRLSFLAELKRMIIFYGDEIDWATLERLIGVSQQQLEIGRLFGLAKRAVDCPIPPAFLAKISARR